MDCPMNSIQIFVDEIGEQPIAVPNISFKHSDLEVKYVEFRQKSTF